MLNRTNRTLSANLNRLNLGTRSLVLKTSVNNGDTTLRARHAHAFAMRDGMPAEFVPPVILSPWALIPAIPCSSPAGPWHGHSRPRYRPSPRVVVPVVTTAAASWTVNLVDDLRQADAAQDQTQARSLKPKDRAQAKPGRTSSIVSRSRTGQVLKASRRGQMISSSAAARTAAAGG